MTHENHRPAVALLVVWVVAAHLTGCWCELTTGAPEAQRCRLPTALAWQSHADTLGPAG